jgi:IclR family acetate operon transcriptional repressor
MKELPRGLDEPRSQTRIQSVSRAVTLLLAVAESPEGTTAKALSDRFELALPTTYHLLTTLWAEGMLTKDDLRIFRLGPRAAVIADAYQRLDSVPAEYHHALQSVVRRTGETAYLGVWRNNGVQVLETAEGAQAVRVVGLAVGYNEDMHARASAKLLLAFAPDDLRDSVVERMRLRRLTPHTITKKADLLHEFDQIRETGLSFDREEFQLGVRCVSAPIWRGDKVVACLTVSAPSHRFTETQDEVIATLQQVTADLRDH